MSVEAEHYNRPVACFGTTWSLPRPADGSHHTATFSKLYEKVRPVCRRAGLKRFSDITGLDRIGIPVVNAIRPSLVGMSVAHGKGVTPEGARASALMESLERYYGFTADLPRITCTYEELRNRYNAIPRERLYLSQNSVFSPNLPEKWVAGWDLLGDCEVMVPWRLVTMRRNHRELDAFGLSSNGLAASLEFLEALSQALLEVIERDALSCHHALMRRHQRAFPLFQLQRESIPFPAVKALLEKTATAGIYTALFDCTVDTRVPTYECSLLDMRDPEMIVCRGMGASLEIETALIRAITEAVQARAIYLSGCRETFLASEMNLPPSIGSSTLIDYLEHPVLPARRVEVENQTSITTTSFEEDINLCLERLREIGIEQVLVVELSGAKDPLKVVKVIVPGLEGCDDLLNYAPGKRSCNYLKDL